MKVAAVTCHFNFSGPTDQFVGPLTKVKEWDHFLFTNDKDSVTSDLYSVVEVDVSSFANGSCATKYYKWMTHLVLPDYDKIIWTDCHWSYSNINYIKHLINYCDDSIILNRSGATRVVSDVDWCVVNDRISKHMREEILSKLSQLEFDCLNQTQMFVTNCMIKNNKCDRLQFMSTELHDLICNVCYRDQPWLPYLFQKYQIQYQLLSDNRLCPNFKITGRYEQDHHRYAVK